MGKGQTAYKWKYQSTMIFYLLNFKNEWLLVCGALLTLDELCQNKLVKPTLLVDFKVHLTFSIFLLMNVLSFNVQERDKKINPGSDLLPGSLLKLKGFFLSPFHILLPCFMKI